MLYDAYAHQCILFFDSVGIHEHLKNCFFKLHPYLHKKSKFRKFYFWTKDAEKVTDKTSWIDLAHKFIIYRPNFGILKTDFDYVSIPYDMFKFNTDIQNFGLFDSKALEKITSNDV